MEWLKDILGWLIHFDKHLVSVINFFGSWVYLILFMVIFAETGLVVTPFLPGDSLLFIIGAISALGTLNLSVILISLSFAAIFGDSLNYAIGKSLGPKVFKYEKSRFFKKEHLEHTHKFYEKYGAKTIVLARFIPIVRTFAPFVAGMGRMNYAKFLVYNVIGGILWVGIFVLGGYYFGNIDFVKANFEFVVLGIIFLSAMPVILKLIGMRVKANKEAKNTLKNIKEI